MRPVRAAGWQGSGRKAGFVSRCSRFAFEPNSSRKPPLRFFRESEVESGALLYAAFRPYAAAVPANNPLHGGQSYSRSRKFAGVMKA